MSNPGPHGRPKHTHTNVDIQDQKEHAISHTTTNGTNMTVDEIVNTLGGINDFRNPNIRKGKQIFLIFKAVDNTSTTRLQSDVDALCEKQALGSCFLAVNTHFNIKYILVYVTLKTSESPNEFKEAIENSTRLICVSLKKVMRLQTLLTSVKVNGYPIVYSHEISEPLLSQNDISSLRSSAGQVPVKRRRDGKSTLTSGTEDQQSRTSTVDTECDTADFVRILNDDVGQPSTSGQSSSSRPTKKIEELRRLSGQRGDLEKAIETLKREIVSLEDSLKKKKVELAKAETKRKAVNDQCNAIAMDKKRKLKQSSAKRQKIIEEQKRLLDKEKEELKLLRLAAPDEDSQLGMQ